jgi:hypothetical protein
MIITGKNSADPGAEGVYIIYPNVKASIFQTFTEISPFNDSRKSSITVIRLYASFFAEFVFIEPGSLNNF